MNSYSKVLILDERDCLLGIYVIAKYLKWLILRNGAVISLHCLFAKQVCNN